MNKFARILRLPRAPKPDFCANSNSAPEVLRRSMGLRSMWVSKLPEDVFANDCCYSCGYVIAHKNASLESYVHEIAHAAVASLKRNDWRSQDNYGCNIMSDNEEVETCYLQFFWLCEYELYGEYSTRRDLLDDYGFLMDLFDQERNETGVASLWRELVQKGREIAGKLKVQNAY